MTNAPSITDLPQRVTPQGKPVYTVCEAIHYLKHNNLWVAPGFLDTLPREADNRSSLYFHVLSLWPDEAGIIVPGELEYTPEIAEYVLKETWCPEDSKVQKEVESDQPIDRMWKEYTEGLLPVDPEVRSLPQYKSQRGAFDQNTLLANDGRLVSLCTNIYKVPVEYNQSVLFLSRSHQYKVTELLTFDSPPTQQGLRQRADDLATIATEQGATHALIDGPAFFVRYLEDALRRKGIAPVYPIPPSPVPYGERDVIPLSQCVSFD